MTDATSTEVTGRFSAGSKLLHWTIAILVCLMLYGGFTLSKETVTTHASIGVVVLGLMIIWLTWNRLNPRPHRVSGPRWQEILSQAVHHLLYLCIFLQPIFGLAMASSSKYNLMVFGTFGLQIGQNDTIHEVFETLHGANGFLIAGLVAVHIAGALYHAVILKDNVLKRMLPFAKV